MQDFQRIGLVNKPGLVGSCMLTEKGMLVCKEGSISMNVVQTGACTYLWGGSCRGETKPAARPLSV